MADNNWLMQIPVISTKHVTRRTMDAINDEHTGLPTVVCPTPWGAFVAVTEDEDTETEFFELLPVFKWASERGYEWIRLDCDGDDIDELPSFDW